jgi:serine/threonine protein kinase
MKSKPQTRALQSLGEYDLLEKIGEGGAGTVYRSRHRPSGQVVAVKVLPEQMAGQEVLLRRFEQEFRAASKLDHPGLVRALDFFDDHCTPFLVMEYIEGESLGQKLERDGAMEENTAIALIVQVCRGLHYIHNQGIIHRDVKPDNILVTPAGEAKLTDLGLIKQVLVDQDLTKTGRGLGTPHFMAPEQFRDAKHVDVRCDVYALGATLYMMVTGKLPFAGDSPMECWMKKMENKLPAPRSLVPRLSPRTDQVIRRAMAPNPRERPACCATLAQELTGRMLPEARAVSASHQEIMHLAYQSREGDPYLLKQSVEKIRQWLQSGVLANARDLRASRSAGGPFQPLDRFPEFADLVPAASVGPDRNTPCPERVLALSPERKQVITPPPLTSQVQPWLIWTWVAGGVLLGVVLGVGVFLFRG